MPLTLAVLASGRGSNLQAILHAIERGVLDARVAGVFSDRASAGALAIARDAGIPAESIEPAAFASRKEFDESLFTRIERVQPDLIVCAGYMRLLGDAYVEHWSGRMVNIHPSLLPLFKGLRTHERALAAGACEHGASVHFVTAELDGGPVIAQARVPVLPADEPQSLAARVLEVEHPLLVGSLALLAAGRIGMSAGRVLHDGRELASPLQLVDGQLIEALA